MLATNFVHVSELKSKAKQKQNNNYYCKTNSHMVTTLIERLKYFVFGLNVKFSEPYNNTFTSWWSEQFFRVWFIANTSSKRSNFRSEFSLQRKRKWFAVSVSKLQQHTGLIDILKIVSEFLLIQIIKV